MARLRVAVVGCGPIGALHAAGVQSSAVAELAGLCDVDQGCAGALALRLGPHIPCHGSIEELFDKERVNVVTVATPDHLHVPAALVAVAAGCHVFCEKPLATTAVDARRLVEAARARGVCLGVDHNRRFGFGYRTARQLLDEGRLGSVRSLLVHVLDRTPEPGVALVPEVILTTLLTHHLDLARWFGGEVKRLGACVGQRDPAGSPLWREVVLTLEFEGGAVGSIVAGYRDGLSRTFERALITGSQGSVQVNDVTRSTTFWDTDPDRSEVFEPNPFSDEPSFHGTIVRHVHEMLQCVAAGRVPPVTGEDGLRGLELVELARRSHAERGVMVSARSSRSEAVPATHAGESPEEAPR